MPRHGGDMRQWCDIVQFLVSREYTEISLNNAYNVMVKNGWQPWTSPQQQYFIGSSSFVTAFTTQTSLQPPPNHANAAVQQELVALSVFIANFPSNNESWFQQSSHDDGLYAVFLASHRTCPHKDVPRALWTCRSNTVLENGKHTKHKLIVAWTDILFSLELKGYWLAT